MHWTVGGRRFFLDDDLPPTASNVYRWADPSKTKRYPKMNMKEKEFKIEQLLEEVYLLEEEIREEENSACSICSF